jgi:hypothetical protein
MQQILSRTLSLGITRCGTVQDVAELVKQYALASLAAGELFFWDERFDQKSFEQEVLARADRYLDLLLAAGARTPEFALQLWARANQAALDGDLVYAAALKEQLMTGPCSTALIFNDRWAFTSEISPIGQEVFPNLAELTDLGKVAFRNPRNRHLIRAFVKGQAPFNDATEVFQMMVWDCIASNPCINADSTDSESPDTVAWAIQDGVRVILESAPASTHWYFTLDTLIGTLDKKVYGWKFGRKEWDLEKFIQKWTKSDSGDEKIIEFLNTETGHYTSYPRGIELVATFVAKFGHSFEVGEKLRNPKQASDSSNPIAKAKYFGCTEFTSESIVRAIEEYEIDSNAAYFLIHNDSIYNNSRTCEALRNYCQQNSDLTHLLNKRIDILRKRDLPHIVAHADAGSFNQIQQTIEAIKTSVESVRSTQDQVKTWIERVKSDLSTAKYWAILLVIILVAKYVF